MEKNARVIIVTSGKGGVGKTTTTTNISAALARSGNRVLAIDGDVGLRNLDIVMGLENRIVYNLCDVVEGACRLEQAVIRDKRIEGLCLLPAAQTRTKDSVSQEDMLTIIGQAKKLYDFIIVDSPAGIESGFRNAAVGADEGVIVCTPDMSSVRDADRIIGLLESMGKKPINLVVNRVRPKGDESLDVSDVLDVLSVDLLGVVPEDSSVVVSTNKGEPLTLSPQTRAGKAFENIARRISGEDVGLMNLEEPARLDLFRGIRRVFGFAG